MANHLQYFEARLFHVPKAYAQGASSSAAPAPAATKKLGLIAVLAENSLLDDTKRYASGGDSATLRERIFAYTQNAQNRIPHSQAFVMGVDSDESTFKIATVLEKMYNEGVDSDLLDANKINDDAVKEEDNTLIGVVLIGNVPVPVVHEEDGTAHPSLYPYTDFYRKRYIYNWQTDRFEANADSAVLKPEIWHGVIVPPSKNEAKARQELAEYFYKNNEYSRGNPDYAQFERRLLYANFPLTEKSLNFIDFRNYERYLKYMEEMVFGRYNKNLFREVIKEAAIDQQPDVPPEEVQPLIDDESLKNIPDTMTEIMMRSYTANLETGLKNYRGKLNEILKKSGRWVAGQTDTPTSLVTVRDEYAKYSLYVKQLALESFIDAEIRKVMDAQTQGIDLISGATLRIKLETDLGDQNHESYFRSFVDGQEVASMESAGQCGMYRGQRKEPTQTVLRNNSVYVEANRMYNPRTLLAPPQDEDGEYDEDWELKKDPAYIMYAGCTANNATRMDYDDTEEDIHLHQRPEFCRPDEAMKPLFDITGAKEANASVPEYEGESGCDLNRMHFQIGSKEPADFRGNENYLDYVEDEYDKTAIGVSLFSQDVGEVIHEAYNKLVSRGKLQPLADSSMRPM
ncbi:hypothetical protein JXA05_01900, partial [Candidatus Peregrinibacteria bacterium]|nr:hypothetical protein [Candidatus Peregrinibacteria bacterium]